VRCLSCPGSFPVNSTEGASQSRRQARASSPRATGPGADPGVLALPRCQSSGPVSAQGVLLIFIVVPGAPGGPGTKVPAAEQVGQAGPGRKVLLLGQNRLVSGTPEREHGPHGNVETTGLPR